MYAPNIVSNRHTQSPKINWKENCADDEKKIPTRRKSVQETMFRGVDFSDFLVSIDRLRVSDESISDVLEFDTFDDPF